MTTVCPDSDSKRASSLCGSALVMLVVLLGIGCPMTARAQPLDCTLEHPPRGLIDAEYTRLLRAAGPLKCPLADEEPVLDRDGAFQEFERGQIVWSPQSGGTNAMQVAYYKPDCTPDSACIVFRWWNMPESDVFLIRLADMDHADILPEEAREGSLEIEVKTSDISIGDKVDKGFDPNGRVFRSGAETLSRTSGAIGVRVNRLQAGRYKFVVKGCTRDSVLIGIGTSTDCPYDWSNTAYVDYEFLNLNGIVNNWAANPLLNDFYLISRRNAAFAHTCRRASKIVSEEPGGDFGTTAMALLGNDPVPLLPLPPNAAPLFSCPREADNLTAYDTKANLAMVQAGDDVLALVGGNCDAGLGPLPDVNAAALKNECLVALAVRNLKKKADVGTDTQLWKDDSATPAIIIGAGIVLGTLGAGIPGALLGGLLADLIADCGATKGDYDFQLQWLVRLMIVHGPREIGGDNKIDERSWNHLLTLLTERGHGDFSRIVYFCGAPIAPETENHQLMIESARYLTNAILTADARRHGNLPDPAYDNATNGQRDLILKRLREVLVEDFYEFNARPYQYLAVYAIRNLYELVERENPADPVAKAAEIVLDYLSGKYAVSANGLRRVANFRRQPHRAKYATMFQAEGDSEFARMALLAGGSKPLQMQRFGRHHPWEIEGLIFHGTGRVYRMPDLIRDYVVRGVEHRKPQDVLQRFRARGGRDDGGLEIHFSTPSFMLSAGGVYVPGQLGVLGQLFGSEQSSSLPTTLILTDLGRGWQEMVRFSGTPDDGNRFNTCVGPNFACGIDPVMPSTIPAGCIEKQAPWTFLNFNSSGSDCNRSYGVHVALYSAPCTSQNCLYGGTSWGLLEAQESPIPALPLGPTRLAAEKTAFQNFQTAVIANNTAFSPKWDQANSQNLYRTTKGRLIQFDPGPLGPRQWSVNHIDTMATPDAKDWPVAQGDVMNALPGQPCIEFDNFFRKTRLILDLRDLSKPTSRWKCEVPLEQFVVGTQIIFPGSCKMPNPCP